MEYTRVKILNSKAEAKSHFSISTDASNFAGGIHFNGENTTFYWKDNNLEKPIHIKEAEAVKIALDQYKHKLKGKTVLLQVDNTAVVSCFQFGSKDKILNRIILDCAEIAIDHHFKIEIVWVPTSEQLADEPSRLLTKAEAELLPSVIDSVENVIELKFTLDLFATKNNAKCENYVTRHFDSDAFGINAFTIKNFHNQVIYAFPPQPILNEAFNHLSKYAQNNIWCLIVRSCWLLPAWFPLVCKEHNFLFLEIGNDDFPNVRVPTKSGLKLDTSTKKTWAFIHFPYAVEKPRFRTLFH